MKDHRLIDERSLAFDRLVAEKLRATSAAEALRALTHVPKVLQPI